MGQANALIAGGLAKGVFPDIDEYYACVIFLVLVSSVRRNYHCAENVVHQSDPGVRISSFQLRRGQTRQC